MNRGHRILEIRREKDWSQRELGRRAGITGVAVGLIEAGKRKMYLDTAIKLADAFGITLDELASRSFPQEAKNE